MLKPKIPTERLTSGLKCENRCNGNNFFQNREHLLNGNKKCSECGTQVIRRILCDWISSNLAYVHNLPGTFSSNQNSTLSLPRNNLLGRLGNCGSPQNHVTTRQGLKNEL